MEESVSYGGGTADGPKAILETSDQLETFDGFSFPCREGIHTIPPIQEDSAEGFTRAIEEQVKTALGHNSIPVVLGGETYGDPRGGPGGI